MQTAVIRTGSLGMQQPIVIDTRNVVDPERARAAGFPYASMARVVASQWVTA
jgi:hypothetical protein